MIVVTGASGQLGRLVIDGLRKKLPASEIVAAVRNPESVKEFAQQGGHVRRVDYDNPDTMKSSFRGADKLLLISSNEVGRRVPQHHAIIKAAKHAGINLIVYTSTLRADTSPLPLATEHIQTEALLKASGIPFVVLRNGPYTENYLCRVPLALRHGVMPGSAGEGRIASASRSDYAQAAVAVLTQHNQAGRVYELAGDSAYTLAEFAAEIARQSRKAMTYQDLPVAHFKAALLAVGLPETLATLLTDSDAGASKGGLFDDSHQLSGLIGRPTTPMRTVLKAAIPQLGTRSNRRTCARRPETITPEPTPLLESETHFIPSLHP